MLLDDLAFHFNSAKFIGKSSVFDLKFLAVFHIFMYEFICNLGSLLDIIKHKMKMEDCKHGVFDEATVATVLREVLKGLEYFHNNGQIHRYALILLLCCINVIIDM